MGNSGFKGWVIKKIWDLKNLWDLWEIGIYRIILKFLNWKIILKIYLGFY